MRGFFPFHKTGCFMFSLLTNSTVSSFPDAFRVIQLPTSCPFALNTLVLQINLFLPCCYSLWLRQIILPVWNLLCFDVYRLPKKRNLME